MVVAIKKTCWGGSKKFEDITFENSQTFNDCRWQENVFEKVMFNFNQGNTINISHSIRKCKKPSIFEHFLVVESFFWLYTKMTPPRMLSWKSIAWTVQKQPSTTIHFRKFFQKIPVMESFFWLNYRLAIPKWLHQECFLGNLPKDFGVPKYHRL